MNATLRSLTSKYPDLESCADGILQAVRVCGDAIRNNGKLLICGNGGSASDSDHLVTELMKGFVKERPVPAPFREYLAKEYPENGRYLADQLQGAIPAISLASHSALMTAIANDQAADMIFAQQVYGYGKPGDVLIAISTSGNSVNVTNAIKVARASHMRTIGLTGQAGSLVQRLCELTIRVPGRAAAEVQERHLPVYHAICEMLEEALFGQ